MSHRREAYAARFLRPPTFLKRVMMREKPRDLTGPFENPVRKFVRLREKSRAFCQLPPPRKVPVPKPPPRKLLGPVPNVPTVSEEVLRKRLNFLLSEDAVLQQNAEPMRKGSHHPYQVERRAWERQMRDIRKIYRAQYLQKLAEVTAIEREKQRQMYEVERAERERRKLEQQDKVAEERKRQAILKDRLRIEAKVTEAVEMARRSKIKRRRLFWVRTFEGLADYITKEKLDIEIPSLDLSTSDGKEDKKEEKRDASSGARRRRGRGPKEAEAPPTGPLPPELSGAKLFSRNVSIPFILRQVGGAKEFPAQKSRRIPFVDNVEREIREASYELLGEDEPQFLRREDNLEKGMDPSERAKLEYSHFTLEEKKKMLEEKKRMLRELEESIKNVEISDGPTDPSVKQMVDLLHAQILGNEEEATKKNLREIAGMEQNKEKS